MAHAIKVERLDASDAVGIREKVPLSELRAFYGPAFRELREAIRIGGAEPTGAPFVRYFAVTPGTIEVEAVLTCTHAVKARGRVQPLHLEAASAAIVRHVGHSDKLRGAYDALTEWMGEHNRYPAGAPREVYVTMADEDPDPSEWVTLVEQPLY